MAPTLTAGFAGVTAIDARVGALIASVVLPFTPLKAAVIVTLPDATPVAKPGVDWPVVKTVAFVVSEEDQLAVLVTLAEVPLLYEAVAVNCCVAPTFTDGLTGVTVT